MVSNESRALVQMLENIKSPAKTIILADRGYETYHVFAHIMAKRSGFVIRKDISRKGGIAYGFRLPDRELDKDGKQAVYPMKLRMVRFLLDTGEYECIVTNLKREEFPSVEDQGIISFERGSAYFYLQSIKFQNG